jgi:hypothetical protein
MDSFDSFLHYFNFLKFALLLTPYPYSSFTRIPSTSSTVSQKSRRCDGRWAAKVSKSQQTLIHPKRRGVSLLFIASTTTTTTTTATSVTTNHLSIELHHEKVLFQASERTVYCKFYLVWIIVIFRLMHPLIQQY